MGYVQKFDVKVRDRTFVRLAIEEHLEEIFTALEASAFYSDIHVFHSNVLYANNVLSFLVSVGIMTKRDAEKYNKKIIDIQKERIYAI